MRESNDKCGAIRGFAKNWQGLGKAKLPVWQS